MLKKILFQLFALVAVATVIGFSLTHLNIPLVYGIAIGIIVQFGVNYAFFTLLNVFVSLKNKKLENERIKEFSHQGLTVTCPCPLKKEEYVPIVLNTNNTYKCDTCQKNINVYIVPETVLVTETIANTNTISIPALAEAADQITDGNS